ncbi:unnamed protein product (macronuclear) [Paramecium tetraurelia]|uniref:Myb/SANT-like domain-containing protein n=1 Tax=Paramecium tetraurelia TaxID=5888 RepID=A0CMS3_PARTE|nr:uncharacterized protein GSPATT00008569001 [Paramecium tetraurelia]CAK72090.1 unnamed protein product [Paramecium tetraurelia]|eukprot:XP_001439487.1 hypothetical protein (macronuclear) [Paramecium tetraurelia strain d4-2]
MNGLNLQVEIVKQCINIFSSFRGGGTYDHNQLKQGEWTELSKHFKEDFQVVLTGSYKNGIKHGLWNVLFRRNEKTRFNKMYDAIHQNIQLRRKLYLRRDKIWIMD